MGLSKIKAWYKGMETGPKASLPETIKDQKNKERHYRVKKNSLPKFVLSLYIAAFYLGGKSYFLEGFFSSFKTASVSASTSSRFRHSQTFKWAPIW